MILVSQYKPLAKIVIVDSVNIHASSVIYLMMRTKISIIVMAAEYVESAVVTDFSTVPSATCVYQFNYKTDTRYVMYQF